jgi:transcriptional regulator with XRE-family HTH domain
MEINSTNRINSTIKRFRQQKGFTQDTIADRLCMARSTYSKLESGSTTLPYEKLVKISEILGVPVYEIIQENGDLFFKSLFDEFSLMLTLTEYTLSITHYEMIPYDSLQPEHLALLLSKKIFGRKAYEATPLGGRIYKFGPKEAFRWMVENCGMAVLFQQRMIKDEYWLKKWKAYKEDLNPQFEIDDEEYFDVFVIMLTMPGGERKLVQFAERDFPEGADEWDALNYIVEKTGAQDGELMAICNQYDPVSEIVS